MVAAGTTVGVSANAPTGIAVTGTGPLGRATVAGVTSKAATVLVTNAGTGPALRATTGPGSGASGIGCVVGDSHEGTGVLGLSEGGDGVRGHSKAGRGGNFSGGAAQIKLTPGSLASHPGKLATFIVTGPAGCGSALEEGRRRSGSWLFRPVAGYRRRSLYASGAAGRRPGGRAGPRGGSFGLLPVNLATLADADHLH